MKMRTTIILIVGLCWRVIDGRPQQTRPGCWYEGKRYQESQVVNTTEPCLRCRCNEGSLRCRLRVCPRLPSPPPSGCTTRSPRDNACCAELVCGDSHESNVTARRDPSKDIRSHDNGCLHEGVRYAPGSAMMGSRRCEYCYCISGNRRCLRPRCLLPLAGCTPLYEPHSCCPVAYNCTHSAHHSEPSLASSSSGNGCRVESRMYDEGEMVREISHKSDCDNCFCAMGGVRCVPLACAPPLQGCTPIVREGHCCPSTYNCSGSIEVKATQNYASYAFISKDYAKFRKETNFFSMNTREDEDEGENDEEHDDNHDEPIWNSTVEGRGHKNPRQESSANSSNFFETPNKFQTIVPTNSNDRVANDESTIARQTSTIPTIARQTSTIPTIDEKTTIPTIDEQTTITTIEENTTITRQTSTIPTIDGKTTIPTIDEKTTIPTIDEKTTIAIYDTETMNNEIPTETMNYEKSTTVQQETTLTIDDFTTVATTKFSKITNPDEIVSNENFGDTTDESATFTTLETTSLSTTESTITTDLAEKIGTSVFESSTIVYDEETSDYSTTIVEPTTIRDDRRTVANDFPITNDDESTTVVGIVDFTESAKITNFTEFNFNEEKNVSKNLENDEKKIISIRGSVTGSPTTVVVPDDIFVMNVTLKTNVSVGHVHGVTMNPVRSIPPDIEAILNITNRKKGDDYDYEYSQPTLPPSLPNVRIIPFVAADALVKNEEESPIVAVTNYPMGSVGIAPPKLGPTVTGTMANFYDIVTQKNRFSPPIETEGGFVPREPPYFDPPYHPTDLNLEIRTGVTVVPADITNPHRKSDELATNCRYENRDFRHGDVLPSSGHCIICICYYGEVACEDEKCTPLKIGCRRLESDEICCGKIVCVDSDESPTVVLDRADPVAASPRQPLPAIDGIVSPDPFRDVIKTEPAPDLPSLIEDMLPYLAERRQTKPSTTPMTSPTIESNVHGHYQLEPDENFPILSNNENSYHYDESSLQNFSNDESTTTITMEKSKIVNVDETKKLENPFKILGSVNTGIFVNPKNVDGSTKKSKIGETKKSELIGDLIDVAETTLTPSTTTTTTTRDVATTSRIKIAEATIATTIGNVNSRINGSSDNDNASSVNSLLKLAGCNIYGRMYRVGRIITELSSPCLECRCTEVGVQCKQLEC